MPIKTFPLGIVDTGAARAQGNRNALAEIQQVNIGQKMQQRNALAPARQAQANLKTDSDRVNFMVKALGTTTDQPSWTAAKQTLIGSGMPQDAIPDQFDENIRDQIIGKATGENIKIGSYNPRDYTPKSWSNFLSSKDPSALKRYETSSIERIANDPGLAKKVTETQAGIFGAKSRAKETEKSKVQLAMQPRIKAAIKAAEIEAKDRGEALTKLGRAKAALPGLQEVVKKLGSLADIGTYTLTGRAFDVLAKELGFAATKGSTARVKMTAIVNNQVLPLLRDTFGAAFTVAEGESLRATLLDVNATPEQKKATLTAFIEQKMRDIETQEREVGLTQEAVSPQQIQEGATATNPQTGQRIIFRGGQWQSQ